jgi:hypothetical protein
MAAAFETWICPRGLRAVLLARPELGILGDGAA